MYWKAFKKLYNLVFPALNEYIESKKINKNEYSILKKWDIWCTMRINGYYEVKDQM